MILAASAGLLAAAAGPYHISKPLTEPALFADGFAPTGEFVPEKGVPDGSRERRGRGGGREGPRPVHLNRRAFQENRYSRY